MEPMRKKSDLTKLLILRELVIEDPKDQRSISESIGITPQAISEYLKKMEGEDLVDLSSKSPRATMEGVENLQRSLLRMKAFVDGTIERLDIIRSTDAIAASDVRKGDELRVFMKDGFLYCEPGKGSPSTGYADNDGRSGEIVMVSGLSGVVEIPRAKMITVEIEPARRGGGSSRIDRRKLDRFYKLYSLEGSYRVAVLDQEAVSLLIRSGLHYDMELPRAPTIIGTIERGVSVLCFGTPHSISRMITSPELSIDRFETFTMKLDDIKS